MAQTRVDDIHVEDVRIPIADIELAGDLSLPENPRGIVLFAHGSGSSRHSSRNKYVAYELNRAHVATLLFDLLTEREEHEERFTRHLRFDIRMLADRLAAATDWALNHSRLSELPQGYFGASTGGGAALVAAVAREKMIKAVVSRGGRPDLAGDALPRVKAPTLLIVGGDDDVVIELNRQAFAQVRCEKRLEIVPGATHLFEEPGTLERVAQLAREWFEQHL
jgi:putative phosphoribosyl transferase